MRFAYADPPYLGCGARYYAKHHSAAADFDKIETHKALIDRLCLEYTDGWALSCGSSNLQDLLPLCPQGVRVAAWVKPFTPFVKKTIPAYAWEPVIFTGGRARKLSSIHYTRDWLAASWRPGTGLTGAKPRDFCMWIFDLLGADRDDHFDDLFPGSGAVSAAWVELCGLQRAGDAPLFSGEAA